MAHEKARKRQLATRKKRTFVLDEDLLRLIRKEAAELKMSEPEYLRLVVQVSEALRTSVIPTVIPAGLLDGGLIKVLLTNPMVLDMFKGMIGNVFSKFGSSSSTPEPQPAPAPVHPGGGYAGPQGGAPPWGAHGPVQQRPPMQQRQPMQQRPGYGPGMGGGMMQHPQGYPMGHHPGYPQGPGYPPAQGGTQPGGGAATESESSNPLDSLTRMMSQFFAKK